MGYEQINGAHDMAVHQKTVEVELEERATPRFTLLIRTAKLVCDSAEYLCVIRDVSAEGVSVRLFHPLPIETEGVELVLEMQTGDCHPVTLIWQKPGEAGFQFVTPVDVFRNGNCAFVRNCRSSWWLQSGIIMPCCIIFPSKGR